MSKTAVHAGSGGAGANAGGCPPLVKTVEPGGLPAAGIGLGWRPFPARTGVLAIVMLVAAVCSGHARAASFDCTGSLTPVERVICQDPELSRLDEQLDRLYRAALLKAADPAAVRESQRAWLESERQRAALFVAYGGKVNVYGLKRLYRERIIELGALLVSLPDILGTYATPAPPGPGAQNEPVLKDRVVIERGPDGAVRVTLWAIFDHGHLCQMKGAGTWEGGYVLVDGGNGHTGRPCTLKIHADGNAVLLRDPGLGCTKRHCGARGMLDGLIVPRWRRRGRTGPAGETGSGTTQEGS